MKQTILLFLAGCTQKLFDGLTTYMTRTGGMLWDSGGGGGPTQQNVTQTNLPEYARPYFERLMARTEASSNRGYTPYGAPRVEGFNADQMNASNNVRNMRMPGQIATGSQTMGQAAQGMLGTANYQSDRIGSTYNPNQTAPQQERVQSQFRPGQFNGAAADAYMNPYQQRVTDVAKREAIRDHNMAGVGRSAQAAQRGSFGGSRAALMQAEADRQLGGRLDDLQTKGSDAAYQNAQQQFERDRGAAKDASQMGLGAAQFNAQQRLAYGQYDEGQREKAAGMAMQGQTANEAARAAAAGIRQKGYGAAGDLGNNMVNAGKTQQQVELDLNNAKYGVGQREQELNQKALDMGYDDFVNQRDYDKQQLAFYSGIMRGVPTTANTDVKTYGGNGNGAAQMAGLGIAGLGAYNAYRS